MGILLSSISCYLILHNLYWPFVNFAGEFYLLVMPWTFCRLTRLLEVMNTFSSFINFLKQSPNLSHITMSDLKELYNLVDRTQTGWQETWIFQLYPRPVLWLMANHLIHVFHTLSCLFSLSSGQWLSFKHMFSYSLLYNVSSLVKA